MPNVYANASFSSCDFGDGFANSHDLLFVGALMYKPNIEGIRWFINSVFPGFRRKYPTARLMVVGRSPSPEARALCESTPGVELCEDVPDLKEYYRRCRAVVVPLLAGGGTRIKILEAALAGRPVLSTPIGAEGLELEDRADILLFGSADDFNARYSLLNSKSLYRSIVEGARKTILTKHSTKQFDAVMDEVLGQIS